jgi:sugar lactone lactonase YvrE
MTQPKLLLGGIVFGESARWHDGRFWFADWGAQEIIAVDVEGRSEVTLRVPFPSLPMCFDWLPDGALLVVSSSEHRVLRQRPDGSLVQHADLGGLAEGWNEIVADGRGYAYVNAICFKMMAGEEFRPGIIAVIDPTGTARQVADGIAFPNGMAITPDNTTLIVAESYASRLTAFDIGPNGDLTNRRVWAELGSGVPDGICLDADGAVWYADVPNKRCVRVREGGEVLRTVHLDRGGFSCALGGEDRRTLFIVATEWGGAETATEDRTGQVLTTEAPSPGVGPTGKCT